MMDAPIRITKIAGRYLVFDVKDVSSLRRNYNICAVFVGTIPQNPTQNVFQGLPVELLVEEAKLLVDKGAAFIADDAASHLTRLSSLDDSSRRAYIQSLRSRRQAAQSVIDQEEARRREFSAQAKARSISKKRPAKSADPDGENLFSPDPPKAAPGEEPSALSSDNLVHFTPTTSADMLDPLAQNVSHMEAPRAYPLYAHLNSKGFYITPGLRFGGDYSVYPGDPFRYHAHFIATSYEWNEEITVLDLVGGGRLGTGVKKGFLIGGKAPGDGPGTGENIDRVRAFTLEWAAM